MQHHLLQVQHQVRGEELLDSLEVEHLPQHPLAEEEVGEVAVAAEHLPQHLQVVVAVEHQQQHLQVVVVAVAVEHLQVAVEHQQRRHLRPYLVEVADLRANLHRPREIFLPQEGVRQKKLT